MTAPRFNGCRSNLASNFGRGFGAGLKSPQLFISAWAQGRTTVPRGVPYFITEVGPEHQIDSCLCSDLLELTVAGITQDGTVFPAAQ